MGVRARINLSERGKQGFSAYEVAVQNGYIGTEAEWLESIKGRSAYQLAVLNGYVGTVEQWLEEIVTDASGPRGLSAYEVAVADGFVGTLQEWLDSLIGADGAQGPQGFSTYELAVQNGYAGTLEEWLEEIDHRTKEDIVALVDVGAIDAGDTIPAGTSIEDFIRRLVLMTFYPTFSNPSASLASNLASSLESGSIQDVILTMTFNRGSINGDNVNGIWNPAVSQGQYAGPAIQYTLNGTNKELVNSHTIPSVQIVDGANIWSGSVAHDIGQQPLDSMGENYSTPLPAGQFDRTVTVNGRRKRFHGVNNSAANSADIRSLANSSLNPANGNTFTINIPVGATSVVFAYPSTLRDVLSVTYVEGLGAEVKGVFTKTLVMVEGANGYSPIEYKVYRYVPVEPFSAVATYNVTI